MTANPRKNCLFDIIFFPLNFQLKRLSFTYRILIRRTPSEQSLNPKGNTHTRSHMICLIVVVFSGLMFERSYQLWNKHGGLRLSAQKSGLRGWVRAGFELSPVPCFFLWQDTIKWCLSLPWVTNKLRPAVWWTTRVFSLMLYLLFSYWRDFLCRNRWMDLTEKASTTYIETERESRQKAHRG